MNRSVHLVATMVDRQDQRMLLNRRSLMLDSPKHFATATIASRGWSVVPVESALHFSSEDAERLAKALSEQHIDYLFAIAAEDLASTHMFLQMQPTRDSLLEFSNSFGHFNFLLTSRDNSWAVLCTTDDYFLVAGEVLFVEHTVGASHSKARALFREFASHNQWPASARQNLLSVLDRYSHTS